MTKERFEYHLVNLDDGRQMLTRFHIGADGKPGSRTVAVVLPADPADSMKPLSFDLVGETDSRAH